MRILQNLISGNKKSYNDKIHKLNEDTKLMLSANVTAINRNTIKKGIGFDPIVWDLLQSMYEDLKKTNPDIHFSGFLNEILKNAILNDTVMKTYGEMKTKTKN